MCDELLMPKGADSLRRATRLPDGQITESCPAPFAKIFHFALTPNQQYIAHRPVPQRGAGAIVTDAGRDAVDTDGAEDDRRVRWTAKSCGPDAPTLVSSWRVNRKRRWQPSMVTGESTKETVKTIACGNAGFFRWTCGDYARVLFSLCTRGCGCIGRPAFPTPSVFGAKNDAQFVGAAPRDCGRVFVVFARSEVMKQSIFLRRRDGLLRGA